MKYLNETNKTLRYPQIYENNPMLYNRNNPTCWASLKIVHITNRHE